MSGAAALARKSKASAMVAAYLDMLEEDECECGYFESARRHNDPASPDYHPITVVPKAPTTPVVVY